jgi:hypothetical protein
MNSDKRLDEPLKTLGFTEFWGWLVQHPNCILRAGTPEAALHDDEELYWHFSADGPILYVQVVKGKRLMGELLVDPERVAYVQSLNEDDSDDVLFELVQESEQERKVAYFFVLAHGFEEQTSGPGKAVH